ncbi:MAG: PQ-loop repeat-containing protein [Mycoplasmoidaceae bacterium]
MNLKDNLSLAILIFGLIASLTLIISYIPLLYRVTKTKQTYGISFLFTLIILLADTVWIIYAAVFWHVVILNPKEPNNDVWYLVFPLLFTNICLWTFSVYLFSFKLINIYKAKKMKITEKEYCEFLYKKINNDNLKVKDK